MTATIITGRYGADHWDLVAEGRDYQVIEITQSNRVQPGLYAYGPGAHRRESPDGSFAEFGNDWVSCGVVRAWNAEDALRNWFQALTQDRVRQDFPPGTDWLTRPFTDDTGQFLPDGAERGDGYDAYAPDMAAVGGITQPAFFTDADTGYVPSLDVLRSK